MTFAMALVACISAANGDYVARWDDTKLSTNTSVLADGPNSGTISRGYGIKYSSVTNAYNSNTWATEEQLPDDFAGKFVQIEVDTTGFSGIKLIYTDKRSGTGPGFLKLYYSSTGAAGPYTLPPDGAYQLLTINNTPHTFDFASIPELNNNPNVVFRLHGWGSSGTNGTLRVFGLSVTDAGGVPVPSQGTIADIKASGNGDIWINTTGTVTSVGGNTNRKGFTIQDETGGLLIDNGGTITYSQPAVGDRVLIATGTKTTFNGMAQLQVATAEALQIQSSGNPLPAPIEFNTVNDFLAASQYAIQSTYVRVKNIYLFGDQPTSGGLTTWLDTSITGGITYSATSDGLSTLTLRLTNDLAGAETIWQNKTRPVVNNPSDRFDVVAVVSLFGGVSQISLNNPSGTIAEFDVDGPIRQATTTVRDWTLY